MKNKKIMMLAIFLVSLLAVSAVSAEDNATGDVVSEGDSINLDDENVLAVEETADEPVGEASVDEDLIGDGELTADDWNYYIPREVIHTDDYDSAIIKIYWPENLTDKYVQIVHNGTMYIRDGLTGFPKDDYGFVEIRGSSESATRITLGDLGLRVNPSSDYTSGKYVITIKHDSLVIGTFPLDVTDWRDEEMDYFKPGLFNLSIVNSVVDLDDRDAVIFTFIYPVKEVHSGEETKIAVHDGRVHTDVDDDIHITSIENGRFREVTLRELAIFDPGTHRIIVTHFGVIANFNLTVTKTYVDDEFIYMTPWNVTELDSPICSISDPTMSGLNGTVTIFADGNKVFSKKLTAARDEEIWIGLNNLTGKFYNGDYTIKVVYEKDNGMLAGYEKSNGKVFSSEAVVSFVGINDTGNIPTTISASGKTISYNQNANLVATLKDNKGNPISGVDVLINIMGVSYPLKTNAKGKISQSLSNLPPGKRYITFTFKNSKYVTSTKKVLVTVKKATPKITAAKKTFKKSVKTKKYTITLKNNVNKVMKNTKVTLKVNKKTFTAKTNSKGQATFKITNLKKKGTFTAVVKYAGSKYYNAKTVKPKITVK